MAMQWWRTETYAGRHGMRRTQLVKPDVSHMSAHELGAAARAVKAARAGARVLAP